MLRGRSNLLNCAAGEVRACSMKNGEMLLGMKIKQTCIFHINYSWILMLTNQKSARQYTACDAELKCN